MSAKTSSNNLGLSIGALGVVFGDIGTSPLYTIKESFSSATGLTPDLGNVLGILSLIFWLVLIIVSGKYITLMMRADNKGEGGILSLHALVLRGTRNAAMRRILILLGIIGAGLFYGDSMITPAISVLSAVEGLEIISPALGHLIVPISIFILIGIFATQQHGTGTIGKFFGPVMLVWFVVIGALGAHGIMQNPIVLQAFNPYHAIYFMLTHLSATFVVMGAVVLAITGCEAIYVDMGHFGRKPIQRAWFFVALPALLLNYYGQGANILAAPESVKNPFFMLAPEWMQIPLVLLATAAAIIASQATISGAFSLTRQAVQLGYLPRMRISHTSEYAMGQVYVSLVNWILMFSVIFLVFAFGSSSNLASAYGVAVTAIMLITTFLVYQTSRVIWHWPLWASLGLCLPLIFIESLLFGSNLFKIMDGGWLSLAIAAAFFTLTLTWMDGAHYLHKQVHHASIALNDFIQSLPERKPLRIKGTAIYLSRSTTDTPDALVSNLKFNGVIHERIIVLHISTIEEPHISKSKRYRITKMDGGFERIDAYYGFMELPSIPLLLKQCVDEETLDLDMSQTCFVVSRITTIPDQYVGLPLWQAHIFRWLYVNSLRAYDFYRIPTNKAFEIGVQVRV